MLQREPLLIDDLDTALEVLNNRTFRVDHPFRTTRKLFGASVLDTEGDEHSRRKRAWMQLFRRPQMEGTVEPVIARAVECGFAQARASGDLSRLCVWIPNRIILDLLGCPDLDPKAHYEKIRIAADILEVNHPAPKIAEVRNYLRNPAFHQGGLFADLAEEDRIREIAVLLVAGVETTIVALELLLCNWARDAQGFAERLAQEGAEQAVLRMLCQDPPLGLAMRYAQTEAQIGAGTCPAGTIINVNIAAVGATEPEMAKIIFGRGRHQCPGKSLALRELTLVAGRLSGMEPEDYQIHISQDGPRPATFRHPGTTTQISLPDAIENT
jgi:cytochrome P450